VKPNRPPRWVVLLTRTLPQRSILFYAPISKSDVQRGDGHTDPLKNLPGLLPGRLRRCCNTIPLPKSPSYKQQLDLFPILTQVGDSRSPGGLSFREGTAKQLDFYFPIIYNIFAIMYYI